LLAAHVRAVCNRSRGMGLAHLAKNAKAMKELAEKGMAPD
jgi:hypothetical protein